MMLTVNDPVGWLYVMWIIVYAACGTALWMWSRSAVSFVSLYHGRAGGLAFYGRWKFCWTRECHEG